MHALRMQNIQTTDNLLRLIALLTFRPMDKAACVDFSPVLLCHITNVYEKKSNDKKNEWICIIIGIFIGGGVSFTRSFHLFVSFSHFSVTAPKVPNQESEIEIVDYASYTRIIIHDPTISHKRMQPIKHIDRIHNGRRSAQTNESEKI